MVEQWQRILQVCVCGGGGTNIYSGFFYACSKFMMNVFIKAAVIQDMTLYIL